MIVDDSAVHGGMEVDGNQVFASSSSITLVGDQFIVAGSSGRQLTTEGIAEGSVIQILTLNGVALTITDWSVL